MNQIPTGEEIRAERDPVRRAILEAMLRIAERRPLHIPIDQISVVGLADEAQIKRHWLNQRHKDLKERYLFIRDNYIDRPEPVDEDERAAALQRRIGELEQRLAAIADERDNWKSTAELFVRAMNVQEVDLARRDTTIARLQRRLDAALSSSGADEVAARRHRRTSPRL
jgi:hypothetical protein